MLRSLGVALLVFVALFVAGFATIALSTRDSSILAKSYLDRAQQAAAATPAPTSPGSGQGEVLDAGELTGAAPAADATQLEVFRAEAQDKLNLWLASAMGLSLLICWAWLLYAHGHAGRVVGPESARAASGGWWGGMVASAVAIGAVSFAVLQVQRLNELVAGSIATLGLLLAIGLTLIAYYVATLLAAPRVVRPSVPLATLLLH